MTTIRIDDKTADALLAIAQSQGVTVEEYLRRLVKESPVNEGGNAGVESFDRELDKLTFDGPTLPGDFSRADIYGIGDR